MVLNIHGGNIYLIARERGKTTREIIDYSANINPLGFSLRIKKVLMNCEELIRNYPDRDAYDLIREISRYHNISDDSILAGNGSTEFIFLLPRVLKPKKTLLVIPTFSEYEAGIQKVNGRVFYFKTHEADAFVINTKKLFKELKKGYDALYICNPANPTGVLTAKETLTDILKCAQRIGTQVIIDETFIDFNEAHSMKHTIPEFENLYILRSMTKFFGLPGLRAGYILSSKKNIAKLREQQEPWMMNALAQYASIESLKDQQFIIETILYVQEARKKLISGLATIPNLKIFPSAANYLLLRLDKSAPMTVFELYENLLMKGIIIRKCDSFKGLNENFFRIAVRTDRENNKLIKNIRSFLL